MSKSDSGERCLAICVNDSNVENEKRKDVFYNNTGYHCSLTGYAGSSCCDEDDVNEIENFIQTDGCLSDELDSTEIKEMCIRNVPFWDKLTVNDISVRRIKTALTNLVYKIELNVPDDGSLRVRKLLLRCVRPHISCLYDVNMQSDILEVLADHHCAPKLLTKFDEIRIEQWLDGYILKSKSINNPSVLTSIATLIAKFQKRATMVAPAHWDRNPFVITTCKRWIKKVREIIARKGISMDISERVEAFNKYEKIIKEYTKKTKNIANDIVFCHNDVHVGNIIVTYHGFRLIDFEYSAFNYVGYEIANMFNEICISYDIDTPPFFEFNEKYDISHELKRIFASIYLSELTSSVVLPSNHDIIDEFLKSVNVHSLGVHILWSLWGLIMFVS